ncbi:MAG TPA: hypothetical protein VN193_06950 [Candidatus Angelobacter sp.]|nr:hypothetical protein [Candidatus Angelobacter sp.]
MLRSGAVIAMAVALAPLAARADQQPVGATANAGTAALSLSINPSALLSIPDTDVQALPLALRTLLTTALAPVVVQVDGASATASRTAAVADLVAGHSDATPVSLNLASLSSLLSTLHAVFSGLAAGVTVPSLQSTLSDVATVTGNSTVMALLPSGLQTQLQTLNTQLGALSAKLAALPVNAVAAVDQLQTVLAQQLGATLQYATGLAADINAAHPLGQVQSSSALTVPPQVSLPPLVSTMPVLAQLAPFGATAVTGAGATQLGASGPQASSSEATTNLSVAPALDLTNLRADMTAIATLLSQVSTTASAIVPQLPGVASIIAGALPGGLSLSSLVADVNTAAAPADQLNTLVQDTQLDRMLTCQTLGTGSCVIASTAITPAGTGLHAISSSKLVDMSLLPLDSAALAGALSALGAQPGTPLLDVQGVQATSDAIIDGTTSTAQASGDVTRIAVAGLVVMDHGQINTAALSPFVPQAELDAVKNGVPVGEPMLLEINTGAGVLTLQITLGTEQRTYTSTQHQNASIGKMQIRLLNGDRNGANPVHRLGASQPGAIVTMNTATVSSEVLGTSTDGTGTTVPASAGSNVTMGQTGLFGPLGFVGGVGLLGLGAALRRRSGRAV